MGMLLRRRYDKAELPDELEAKAKESDEQDNEKTESPDDLTVAEIKELLDAAGIEYKANEKKQDLIEKLKGE